MPSIEEIQEQIRNQGGLSKFLARREVKTLPSILWEDEIVENIIQGTYNNATGILVATNKRLVFLSKGVVKLKVEDFSYDKISSIQYETGILLGKIIIFTSGNRAEIKNTEKPATRLFAEFVRSKISTKPASVVNPLSSDGDDKFMKIEKLATLKEKGILTDDEFNREKKKLLSS